MALLSDLTRFMLQSERFQMLRPRSNEADAVRGQALGELAVLRQEAVARMHRLRAGLQARGDDGVYLKIALGRRRRADAYRLVSVTHGTRKSIRVGINGHRRDSHTSKRSTNPSGDFTAVGDQDFAKHGISPRPRRK